MSIIIYKPTSRELVAYGVTLEDAVRIKSDLGYYFSKDQAERAAIVPDEKAEALFAL